MTALAAERMASVERITYRRMTLASGYKGWKNALAAVDPTTGKLRPAVALSRMIVIGKFAETVDATAGDKTVNVNFGREFEAEWWTNSSGSPVAATDVGNYCLIEDDQTVAMVSAGAPVAGRIWDVSSTRGVLVERMQSVPVPLNTTLLAETTLAAFSSNNINVGASPASNVIYDVPATGAASTITLPAVAAEGTVLHFVADGTKNGHTVQYRDATGPTAITTALTASKRHLVIAAFLNGIWNANAYVSP